MADYNPFAGLQPVQYVPKYLGNPFSEAIQVAQQWNQNLQEAELLSDQTKAMLDASVGGLPEFKPQVEQINNETKTILDAAIKSGNYNTMPIAVKKAAIKAAMKLKPMQAEKDKYDQFVQALATDKESPLEWKAYWADKAKESLGTMQFNDQGFHIGGGFSLPNMFKPVDIAQRSGLWMQGAKESYTGMGIGEATKIVDGMIAGDSELQSYMNNVADMKLDMFRKANPNATQEQLALATQKIKTDLYNSEVKDLRDATIEKLTNYNKVAGTGDGGIDDFSRFIDPGNSMGIGHKSPQSIQPAQFPINPREAKLIDPESFEKFDSRARWRLYEVYKDKYSKQEIDKVLNNYIMNKYGNERLSNAPVYGFKPIFPEDEEGMHVGEIKDSKFSLNKEKYADEIIERYNNNFKFASDEYRDQPTDQMDYTLYPYVKEGNPNFHSMIQNAAISKALSPEFLKDRYQNTINGDDFKTLQEEGYEAVPIDMSEVNGKWKGNQLFVRMKYVKKEKGDDNLIVEKPFTKDGKPVIVNVEVTEIAKQTALQQFKMAEMILYAAGKNPKEQDILNYMKVNNPASYKILTQ